jgi:hypothetical protein
MSQTTANMTGIHASIVLIVSLVAQPVYGQKATKNPVREPVQASVACRITATFTGGIDGFPNQCVNGISREKSEKKRMGRVLDTWACSMPKLLLPPLKKWLQWTNPNFVSQLQFRTDEMGV